MMVGNDVDEDLIASTLEIETYRMTNCLINSKNLNLKIKEQKS